MYLNCHLLLDSSTKYFSFLQLYHLYESIIPPPPAVRVLFPLKDKHPIFPIVPVYLFFFLPFIYFVPKLSPASSSIEIFLFLQIDNNFSKSAAFPQT